MMSLSPLIAKLQDIATLGSAKSVLAWDQEVYLPARSIQSRSKQISLLSKLSHDLFVSSDFQQCLGQYVDLSTGECSADVSAKDKALLREVYRDWKKATTIPSEFLAEYSHCCSEATHVWQDARKKACFDTFKPYLSRLIDFNKKMADYIDSSKATYDVLLDAYEPGITAAQIKLLFDPLKTETVALLNKIQTRSKTFKTFQDKRFDCDKQWAYTLDILKDMGFDFERGRQDKSTHPFTIHMHPSDVRVTTRLNDKDPFEAITSTIHEGGHGLYEQGLPEQYFGTPLGESVSLGIHESQSRLWENHVGRSLAFWESQYAAFASYFPKELSDITATDLFEMVNVVQPGPIRVEADEVSYNLHVLIRFEIESALFDGSLQVHQLPEAWNAAYQNYLNVTVQNDAEGVLQDIHWAGGSFGYFPTYTIGTLMAAQLFDQIETEFPTLNTDIRSNQLLGIKRWLNEHIHAYGREYMANELIEKATGKPFSSTYYLNYMKQKYSALYALQS